MASNKADLPHKPSSAPISHSRLTASAAAATRTPSSFQHGELSHLPNSKKVETTYLPPSQPPPAYQTRAPGMSAVRGTNLKRDNPEHMGTSLRRDEVGRNGTSLQRDLVQNNSMPKPPISMTSRRTQEPSIIKDAPEMSSHHTQKPTTIKQPLRTTYHLTQEPSIIKSQAQPSSYQRQEPSIAKPRPATLSPNNLKSVLVTPEDIHMATRQTQYEKLAPIEQQKQENWAQSIIKRVGICPEGNTWNRRPGGYQCNGFGHGITDEMLAEGKGGIYALRAGNWAIKDGPYYPNPNKPGNFLKFAEDGTMQGMYSESGIGSGIYVGHSRLGASRVGSSRGSRK